MRNYNAITTETNVPPEQVDRLPPGQAKIRNVIIRSTPIVFSASVAQIVESCLSSFQHRHGTALGHSIAAAFLLLESIAGIIILEKKNLLQNLDRKMIVAIIIEEAGFASFLINAFTLCISLGDQRFQDAIIESSITGFGVVLFFGADLWQRRHHYAQPIPPLRDILLDYVQPEWLLLLSGANIGAVICFSVFSAFAYHRKQHGTFAAEIFIAMGALWMSVKIFLDFITKLPFIRPPYFHLEQIQKTTVGLFFSTGILFLADSLVSYLNSNPTKIVIRESFVGGCALLLGGLFAIPGKRWFHQPSNENTNALPQNLEYHYTQA